MGAPVRPGELCRKLSEIEGIVWIRLQLSLYPDQFDDELIDEIAVNLEIVKYLDIPIQTSTTAFSRSEPGAATTATTSGALLPPREKDPGGLVLRTSLISGLPGEGREGLVEL